MSRTIGLTFLVLLLAFSSAISESAEKEVSSESSSLESSSQSEETSNEQGIKSNSGSGSESASHETSTESEGLKSDIDGAAEAHDAGTKKKGPSINVGNTGGLIPPIDVNVHTDINSPHDNKDGHKGHHGHGDKGHDHGDKGHDHGDKGHHGDKGGHGDHSDKHHGGGGIGDIVDSIEALGQAKPMPILPAKYGQGSKLGGPKKKLKKKKGGSWLPLLFIPLLIQIKIIPFIVLKLKMLATKALLMGKLALIILAFNAIRTAYLGSDNIDSQYEKEVMLAKEQYGYTGGPEYGAWINRRQGNSPHSLAYRGQLQ